MSWQTDALEHTSPALELLAGEAMVDATKKFVKEQVTNIGGSVDIIRIREVYNQISHIAGESMLAELN